MATPAISPKLIGSVNVQPATVRPGESVFVQVCDAQGRPYADDAGVRITIQGVEAAARHYQFATPGTRKLTVRAVKGNIKESAVVTIQVAGEPLLFHRSVAAPAVTAMPVLHVGQAMGRPYLATFTLGTPASLVRWYAKHLPQSPAGPATKVTASGTYAPVSGGVPAKPVAVGYKWDFGDGQVLTTQSPAANHDYFPSMQAGKVAHSFHVRCTIEHDNLTVERTLVLHSAYGLCKQTGTIVPHVVGDIYATNQHVGFSGSVIVHNIESKPITLNEMACVALGVDSKVNPPAPKFIAMKNAVTLKANSATGMGVYVPVSELTPNAPGFTVYYKGFAADGKKTPVRFSYTFRISLKDSHAWKRPVGATVESWNSQAALKAISAAAMDPKAPVSKPGDQMIDPATNTVAMTLSANPHSVATLANVAAAVRAGLTSIAASVGAITPQGTPVRTAQPIRAAAPLPPAPGSLAGPPPPGPVQAGQVCDPDNISDADAAAANAGQLVCQLTNVTETVLMPGSFQNALKGDVILSPGGDSADDIIGGLLRSLSPPQFHSHSGIMTENFTEITHCTGSVDRFTSAENLVGPEGALGIKPDVLQYVWPGSITQSIDAATNGENWNDPNSKKQYKIAAFNPEALGIQFNGGFMLVPPLVVKPLPENEGQARPILRKVADTARTKGARVDSNGNLVQKGGTYYCFYGYTKPEIGAGFGDPAGPAAGWAQGLSPAVCSSFIWLCMKENNVPLVTAKQYETPGDLSPVAVADGAQVGVGTLDGLFYYPQAERQAAAQVLDQTFDNMILEHEGFFADVPLLGTDVANAIADQILNMFALNNPNMYGSSAWQNAVDANAVSPDNIRWWNAPLLGYAEPLQYLQQHTEQYTVSRWTKVISRGAVSGTVTSNGAPVPGAYVYAYDGKSTTCDSGGRYKLDSVPIGKYELKAHAVVGGIECSATQAVDLTAAKPDLTVNLALKPPSVAYRRLDLLSHWTCDHGDANPFHHHGWISAGPDQHSFPVGPGLLTNSCVVKHDYNPFFRIEYTITGVLSPHDLSIQVTIVGKMIDDGSGQEQGERSISFRVPENGQFVWELDLECTGFSWHNGPSKFTGTATNNQETG